jgi:hypothetical protein
MMSRQERCEVYFAAGQDAIRRGDAATTLTEQTDWIETAVDVFLIAAREATTERGETLILRFAFDALEEQERRTTDGHPRVFPQ